MRTIEFTARLSDAELAAIRAHTKARSAQGAVIALIKEGIARAQSRATATAAVLTEGKKKLRASPQLLEAVTGYRRDRAVQLSDEQLDRIISGHP